MLLPFARLLIQAAVLTSDRSWLPAASCTRHVLENAARSLAAMAYEAIGFEELLSELIARARMLRPHETGQYIAGLWGTLPYPLSCE